MKRTLLIATVMSLCACDPTQDKASPDLPVIDLDLPTLNTKAGNFSSCEEITAWRAKKAWQWNYYNPPGVIVPVSGTTSASAPASSQTTNVREVGVDEPDIVKADDHSLFVARAQSVEILNKESLAAEQTLTLEQMSDITLEYSAGRLIVLGYEEPVLYMPPPYFTPRTFTVRTYTRGANGKLTFESHQSFDGTLVAARLSGQTLTFVTSEYVDFNSTLTAANGKIRGISCTDFQKPLFDDFTTTLTYIHRLNLTTRQDAPSARFGRADSIYMTPSTLVLLQSGIDWMWRDERAYGMWQQLTPSFYDLQNGKATFLAAGTVAGNLRDDFAINLDSTGALALATTMQGANGNLNRLWMLQRNESDLVITGFASFAEGEDIRSVRFLNDKAYIVTFRQRDPLFVFDVSDAQNPYLMSELSLSGFSAYLHPLADGTLLGVGYDSNGQGAQKAVQVSLFDLSSPAAPALLDQQSYGSKYSFVDAARDHHAFFADETAIALPVRLFKPNLVCNAYGPGEREFTGAIVLTPGAPLSESGKITHWDWIPDACRETHATWWSYASDTLDVSRVLRVGTQLISVSPFGVRASDPAQNYSTSRELKFQGADDECQRILHKGQVYLGL